MMGLSKEKYKEIEEKVTETMDGFGEDERFEELYDKLKGIPENQRERDLVMFLMGWIYNGVVISKSLNRRRESQAGKKTNKQQSKKLSKPGDNNG